MRPPSITRDDLTLCAPFMPPSDPPPQGPRGVVFFDLGGVVFDLQWDAFFFKTMEALQTFLPGESPQTLKERLVTFYTSPAIQDWERGRLGPASFAQHFRDHMGVPQLPLALLRRLHSTIVGAPRPQVIQLAQDLASRGWGIGVLSNSTPWHEVDLVEGGAIHRWAHIVVFSHDHNLCKPQPEFYERALEEARWRLNCPTLSPQNCYFVDDTPDNVKAAQALGWQSRLVSLLKEEHTQAAAHGQLSTQGLTKLSMDEGALVVGQGAAERVLKLLEPLLGVG